MRKTLIVFGLFVALATAATSQTTTSYFNRIAVTGAGTFGGGITAAGVRLTSPINLPQITWQSDDEPTNEKRWLAIAVNGDWQLRAYDDNSSSSNLAASIARSGTTVGALTWGVTQQLGLGASASAPFYSVSGDSDTGMYFPAANQVGIATGGTLRSTWASTGQTNTVPFLGPDGSAAAPAFAYAGDPDTGMAYGPNASHRFYSGGVLMAEIFPSLTGGPSVSAREGAYGSGNRGAYLFAGRNTSGSGAAGSLMLEERGGTDRVFWAESGLLRIGTSQPTENDSTSHTGGSVVGDQTSFLASKDLLGQPSDGDLLDAVLRTPIYHFRYKDGRYDGETFTGIVTDYSPHFGKDHNKALNEINAVGYLVGSVRELERRIAELERQLQARQ